jgi:hypothetical protein
MSRADIGAQIWNTTDCPALRDLAEMLEGYNNEDTAPDDARLAGRRDAAIKQWVTILEEEV